MSIRTRATAIALVFAFASTLAGCGSFKRFIYEGFGRDDWQQPDEVISLLGIGPGTTVADVGAGGGYFTFRFADAVGDTGRVYAVDVDDSMIEYLEERAADEKRTNVRVIRGGFEDPMLPDGEIDVLFTCNTYHHIEDRVAYFGNVKQDLAPDGKVAIIDLIDGDGLIIRGHATDKAVVLEEMEAAGYRLTHDHALERQNFLVFAPKG
jgi:ubiquinone/menaquinone biosynthesis C-methylase UbiE